MGTVLKVNVKRLQSKTVIKTSNSRALKPKTQIIPMTTPPNTDTHKHLAQ